MLCCIGVVVVVVVVVFGYQCIVNFVELMCIVFVLMFDEMFGVLYDEMVVFVGGCFWGVQGVFEYVKGVKQVIVGYVGGVFEIVYYVFVGLGLMGYVELVWIVYDLMQIMYGWLLQVFFLVVYDLI